MRDEGFYDAMAAASSARHGVPVSWIKAFIGKETSFQIPAPRTWEPKVGEYAYGPMQILLSTARDLYPDMTAAELEFPESNVEVGAAYIRTLIDRVGNDFRDVYSAYNSGSPDNWKDPTSAVAANVAAALTWLQKFGSDEIVAAGATVSDNAGILTAGAFAVLILFLMRRKGA